MSISPTGLFRVREIIHPPPISLLDGPILKIFGVVIQCVPKFVRKVTPHLSQLYVDEF